MGLGTRIGRGYNSLRTLQTCKSLRAFICFVVAVVGRNPGTRLVVGRSLGMRLVVGRRPGDKASDGLRSSKRLEASPSLMVHTLRPKSFPHHFG